MDNDNITLFTGDYYKEGMLYAKIIRSSIPNGKIISINKPEIPDSISVISAGHIPGINRLSVHDWSMPVLADKDTRYEGEPVLLICGTDEKEIEDYAESIDIIYETDYTLLSFRNMLDEQIAYSNRIIKGDPDAAFANAFQVIEGEYITEAQNHYSSIPQCVIVKYLSKKLEIFCSSRWPYHVRDTIADVIGTGKKNIKVISTHTSSSCDGNIWFPSLLAAQAALISWKEKKDVCMRLGRKEQELYTPKGAQAKISFKTALNKEGLLLGQDISINVNTGAYPLLSTELLDRMCRNASGLYKDSNVRIRGKAVVTSTPPMDAFNGLGASQVYFAVETHTSRIAELSQSDPYIWKQANLAADKIKMKELISSAAAMSDFRRKFASYEMLKKRRKDLTVKKNKLRGIGLSIACQNNGLISGTLNNEPNSIIVRLDKEGILYIHTSASEPGIKTREIWIKTAEEILGISEEKIRIIPADTINTPNSGPSILSRHITEITALIKKGCQSIQKKRFRDPLPIEVKRSIKRVRLSSDTGNNCSETAFSSQSSGVSVVEIELDPVTYQTEIRGIWTVIDCGRVFNKVHAGNSVETGIIQALSWCEDISPMAEKYPGFIPAYANKIPEISINFHENRKTSPVSVKELPGNLIPSAYIAALSQAAGFYFDRIPVTPNLIYKYSVNQKLLEQHIYLPEDK